MEPSQANPLPTVTPVPNGRPASKKKWLILLSILIIVVGGIVGFYLYRAQQDAADRLVAEPGQVLILTDGFSPATIRVKKGQVVTWTNQDTKSHAIVADTPDSDLDGSEALEEGDIFSYSFDAAGTYSYHDQSQEASFKGVVIVE